MTDPMTETLVAIGIQQAIAGLDLSHPHARQMCLELVSRLESSLGKIRNAEWDAEEAEIEAEEARQALRHVAAEKFDFGAFVKDVYNPMVQAMYGKRGA